MQRSYPILSSRAEKQLLLWLAYDPCDQMGEWAGGKRGEGRSRDKGGEGRSRDSVLSGGK